MRPVGVYSARGVLNAGRYDKAMLPKILYITSCGHSGSTLLDSMISAHPNVFSVGEIYFIHLYAHVLKEKNEVEAYGNECTCGAETIWDCAFWTRVEESMASESGMSLKDLNFRETEDIDEYRRQNVALFKAVADISGAEVIVDSSKAPQRLHKLMRTGAFDITPVHLIRNPKGMVYSHIKKNITARHFGLKRTSLLFTKRVIQTRLLLRGMDFPTVRYERFVQAPEEHLRRIMPAAGLDFVPEQMEWANTEKHNIGGNTNRRNTSSEIRLDTKWKTRLTMMQKLTIDTIALPGKLAVAGRSIV